MSRSDSARWGSWSWQQRLFEKSGLVTSSGATEIMGRSVRIGWVIVAILSWRARDRKTTLSDGTTCRRGVIRIGRAIVALRWRAWDGKTLSDGTTSRRGVTRIHRLI